MEPNKSMITDQIKDAQRRLSDVRKAIDRWHIIVSFEFSSPGDVDAAYEAVKQAFSEYSQSVDHIKRMINQGMTD